MTLTFSFPKERALALIRVRPRARNHGSEGNVHHFAVYIRTTEGGALQEIAPAGTGAATVDEKGVTMVDSTSLAWGAWFNIEPATVVGVKELVTLLSVLDVWLWRQLF